MTAGKVQDIFLIFGRAAVLLQIIVQEGYRRLNTYVSPSIRLRSEEPLAV